MSSISTLGFNGEYLDTALDNYHLGNGYRAYNPTTMQFTAPDDMSPFGVGGINPYMYCSGDPINNTDPTGHFNFLGVGVNLGMIGFGIGIALSAVLAIPTGGSSIAAGIAVLGAIYGTYTGVKGVVADAQQNHQGLSTDEAINLGVTVGAEVLGFGAGKFFGKVTEEVTSHVSYHTFRGEPDTELTLLGMDRPGPSGSGFTSDEGSYNPSFPKYSASVLDKWVAEHPRIPGSREIPLPTPIGRETMGHAIVRSLQDEVPNGIYSSRMDMPDGKQVGILQFSRKAINLNRELLGHLNDSSRIMFLERKTTLGDMMIIIRDKRTLLPGLATKVRRTISDMKESISTVFDSDG